MTDDEVFQACVAPQGPHRLKISGRLVSRVSFFIATDFIYSTSPAGLLD